MPHDLHSLRIDKSLKSTGGSRWAARWIIAGILIFLLLGVAQTVYSRLNRPLEVRTIRIAAEQQGTEGSKASGEVILNATGYIVAHHKIQLASKVVGKVAWIGVEKGDRVKQGQVIVRLEDDEYRAQLQQAKGQLQALEARLLELNNGSRPEEIAAAQANLNQAKADQENARVTLERTRNL
jgi:HlyD family secretion protein